MAILKLKPSGKDYIWGGHKLVDNYGKEMTGDRLAKVCSYFLNRFSQNHYNTSIVKC